MGLRPKLCPTARNSTPHGAAGGREDPGLGAAGGDGVGKAT